MVEISFYLLSLVAITMLLFLFRGYSMKKVIFRLLGGVTVWIAYLIVLDQTRVLRDFGFPPKMPLLIVVPVLLLMALLIRSSFMRRALENTPVHVPIALQSFRIFVELLIYATYLKGVFPQRATFEGLNFDILVGISAILVSIAASKKWLSINGILTWNLVSMCVLTVTIYSFVSTFYFSDFPASGAGFQFAEFPYLLLVSILLPTAIFLHVFSIKQVLIQKKIAASSLS